MTEYTIEKGKWNFQPVGPWCPRRLKPMSYEFSFDPSAFYTLGEVGDDNDFYDINKLVGLTAMFTANNKQSAMIGWRPSDTKLYIQLFAYTNDKSGGWRADPLLQIPVNQKAKATIDWRNNQVKYTVEFENTKASITHSLPTPPLGLVRPITLSFGGANNSPGDFGGVAHKRIKIFLSYL